MDLVMGLGPRTGSTPPPRSSKSPAVQVARRKSTAALSKQRSTPGRMTSRERRSSHIFYYFNCGVPEDAGGHHYRTNDDCGDDSYMSFDGYGANDDSLTLEHFFQRVQGTNVKEAKHININLEASAPSKLSQEAEP